MDFFYFVFSMIHEGYIYKMDDQCIYVKFDDKFFREYDREKVDISFKQSRKQFRRQLHAVEEAKKRLGDDWLFPTIETAQVKPPRIVFYETQETSTKENKNVSYFRFILYRYNKTQSKVLIVLLFIVCPCLIVSCLHVLCRYNSKLQFCLC